MNDNKIIADLLLPDIKSTPEDYEKKYQKRNINPNALVTRFAPSPTGFLHLGSLFAAMISERLAHQSEEGIFYLRVEDTDKKREVEGSIEEIVKALNFYNIAFDEGVVDGKNEKGEYGPYKQSDREIIYKTYVKDLLEKGLAYPCFCSTEELDAIREKQQEEKVNTGYYGKWAKCRELTLDEIKANLAAGKSYVIRLKSPGNPENRIKFDDLIKGHIEMPENDQDIVILKSDNLPTYHFAHAVDDHLMRTTHVIRGEEWLSSVPTHVQLFEVLGFEKPKFAHITSIMKMDGNSKRKLSKRKDPELSFSFYDEQGYPVNSVIEYLLTLANSNFEEWRIANPFAPYSEFQLEIGKMSASGPLFDIDKFNDVSKNAISIMKAGDVTSLYLEWAEKYDTQMADLIKRDKEYAQKLFNIEREVPRPRKDYAKWSEVKFYIGYFYDEVFDEVIADGYSFPEKLAKEDIKAIVTTYKNVFDLSDDKDLWFEKLKDMAETLGFARDGKTYKKNKEAFKGQVGDIATVLRVAFCNKTNSQDLYDMMNILGKDRVMARLERAAAAL